MTKKPSPLNVRPATRNPNSRLLEEAKHLGFLTAGFSRPERPVFFDRFCEWIAANKQGDMRWMGKHLEIRKNPKMLLEGCQTIVSLSYPYSQKKPCTPDGFTTSRYTEPKKTDYHDRLRELGRRLARVIAEAYPESRTKIFVDSAPILERSFAYESGTGFIGKNNMFIIPWYGSYIFLMEILTTASLPLSKNMPMESQCGTCTRCLDSCPSGAIERPFFINASKCFSYLTVEFPGPLNSETGKNLGMCFLGCDICQEVCPFNEESSSRDFSLPSIDQILEMREEKFEKKYGKTAFARAGIEKIKSNIKAIRSGLAS